MKSVLILCTGNSCRSQMAEALWNLLGAGNWKASSAGSKPAGFVHPMAIEVMTELGLDLSKARSKSISDLGKKKFDLAVTVCDSAAESCPTLPATETFHWPFDDPAHATGNEQQRREEFRRVRDEIKARIAGYLEDD
ncbi:MAG: arsenate reductase ArsC [Planctomycetales bacterium]|nr:arsenate reductase ArsC [Planctomycetales bacterium]